MLEAYVNVILMDIAVREGFRQVCCALLAHSYQGGVKTNRINTFNVSRACVRWLPCGCAGARAARARRAARASRA